MKRFMRSRDTTCPPESFTSQKIGQISYMQYITEDKDEILAHSCGFNRKD